MDIGTLSKDFLDDEVIDETEAIVWTERYSTAGDCVIALEDTADNRRKLPMGKFIANSDSNEVMIIETREMKDGLLTVSGPSLTAFLEHRAFRISGYWNAQSADLTIYKPGYLMGFIVQQMCMDSGFTKSEFPLFGLNGYRQKIRNLYLGDLYDGGVPTAINVPYGPIYSILKTLGETYHIGFKMYLESASPQGYVLRFTTYAGQNLTPSGPDQSKQVTFSPTTESLQGTSMLESIAGYKNVAYAYATNWVTPSYAYGVGEAYAPGFDPAKKDFDRRVLQVFVSDIQIPEGTPTEDAFGRPPGDPPPGYVLEALHSKARDALANNNYTRLVDGEVVPQSQYKFGEHYNMGDYVSLASGEDYPNQTAQIVEFIRTKDSDGERAYPTVSIVDYL